MLTDQEVIALELIAWELNQALINSGRTDHPAMQQYKHWLHGVRARRSSTP